MNHDYECCGYNGTIHGHGREPVSYGEYPIKFHSDYSPRFRVTFSRGEMQFSVELSASDERNAIYNATKSFTKYVPNTELWGVFKVERV